MWEEVNSVSFKTLYWHYYYYYYYNCHHHHHHHHHNHCPRYNSPCTCQEELKETRKTSG
jgi:hypothetical protein